MKRKLAILLALTPVPALADLRAVYDMTPQKNRVLTIEVADDGTARGQLSGQEPYFLLSAEGDGFVVTRRDGRARVFRADDLITVLTERSANSADKGLSMLKSVQGVKITARNVISSVQGMKGRLYEMGPPDQGPKSMIDVVVSDDPKLRRVGLVFTSAYAAFEAVLLTMPNPKPSLFADFGALLRSGTLLKFGPLVELRQVEESEIADARFSLPAQPLSLEAARTELLTLFTPKPLKKR